MPAIPVTQGVPGPADLTTFTIKVDGEAVPGTYGVLAIDIERSVNRIPAARLILYDGDPAEEQFTVSSEDVLVPGNEITIEAGYSSDEEVLFKGIITKQRIEVKRGGRSLLHVEARDAAFRMTLARKSRYFTEVSDQDVFEQIIGEYSDLSSDLSSADSTTYPEVVQVQATDWDVLVTRAEKIGLICLAQDGSIRVLKPDTQSSPSVTLTYGSGIFDLDMEMDARTQLPEVVARAWDPANQEILSGDSDQADTPAQGNIDGKELSEVGDLEEYALAHSGSLQEGEVTAWAAAQMLKSRLSRIRGSVRIQGRSDIKVGDLVELGGLGERFNGQAFVSGLRHMLGEGDWTTTIELGLDFDWHIDKYAVSATRASGFHPAIGGLQIGIVTQLQDDPEGEDRILVRIPTIDAEAEGTWARIGTLDAGNERGTFFRPEIGDEVVVGFLNEDPHEPIILGMLNSSAKPAPMTASDDNHEKGFVTRSGMKFVFDDDKASATLETPNGNKIVLDDDGGEITISDESGNTVTLSADGISLESAKDLVLKASNDLSIEAVNLKMNANASATVEGSAGAALKSGGTTEVKGSLVQIN